jgi:hypothetical protein
MFSLIFDKLKIPFWAERYPIEYDNRVENIISPRIRKRHYLSLDELIEIC